MVSSATVEALLREMGETPERPGLVDTPKRVARMYAELVNLQAPAPALTTFPANQDGVKCDEMVVVTDMPFYSLCEHHVIPFFGKAHIGYVPGDSIVGLSKFAKVVQHFARRLQVQERLTAQIADYLYEGLKPRGICVFLSAEHLCMSMRGAHAMGTQTSTHAIRGKIDKDEFLQLLAVRK